MAHRVYLSLGSNLGTREANLRAALDQLAQAGLHVLRQSSLYETEPQDVPDQPWFLNLVVEAATGLAPETLLGRLQQIEARLGRHRLEPKGPRTIDLDILLYDDLTLSTPALNIPHPRFAERKFVLEPLAEIAPGLRHPATGQTVEELLAAVGTQKVAKIRDSI
jgi:2-amino-4-hydroxy-6-hydroxymethyldihydropteridine diphosphokinase